MTNRKKLAAVGLVVLLSWVGFFTLGRFTASVTEPQRMAQANCTYGEGNFFDIFGLDGVDGAQPLPQVHSVGGYCEVLIPFTEVHSPAVVTTYSDCHGCLVGAFFNTGSEKNLLYLSSTRVSLDPVRTDVTRAWTNEVVLLYSQQYISQQYAAPDISVVAQMFDSDTTVVQSSDMSPRLPHVREYSSVAAAVDQAYLNGNL